MRNNILWALFIAVIIMSACKHKPATTLTATPTTGNSNNTGGNNNNNDSSNNADTGICFTRDVLPIFISNCAKAGCHDAATAKQGFQFTDYNSIVAKEFVPGNAEKTELYVKITEDRADKRMPPPPNIVLTTEQVFTIKQWINEGAENSSGCASFCDSNNYNYMANIQPIFDKYCKGCHNANVAPKGVRLDTYSGTLASVNTGRLLGAIRRNPGFAPMPNGGDKLSNCEITQIVRWIEAGAQNN